MFNFFKRSKSQSKGKQKQHQQQQQQQQQQQLHPDGGAKDAYGAGAGAPVYCVSQDGDGEQVKNRRPEQQPPAAATVEVAATAASASDITRASGSSRRGQVDDDDQGNDGAELDGGHDADSDVIDESDRSTQGFPTAGAATASTNQGASLIESTMAKGKNKRRYQQQQYQQKQQQPQQQSQQQPQQQQQQQQPQHVNSSGEKCGTVGHLLTFSEQSIKVMAAASAAVSQHGSDVAHEPDVGARQDGDRARAPPGDADPGDVNCSVTEAKNSVGCRSAAALAPLAKTHTDGVTVAAAAMVPVVADGTPAVALLSVKSIAGVSPSVGSVVRPLPAELPSVLVGNGQSQHAPERRASSEPVVNSRTGGQNHRTEMGQQPSRATSEQPVRLSPSPPPPPKPVRNRPPAPSRPDAARDDISDDRDVFYEATESLVLAGGHGGQPPAAANGPVPSVGDPEAALQQEQRKVKKQKQVSFKLNNDGSPEVHTSDDVDVCDVDDSAPVDGGRNHSAFSDSKVGGGICEDVALKRKLIEFKYDDSVAPEEPKDKQQKHADGTALIEDSVSLPDVVQPTPNIEALKAAIPFNTVEKLNSEMKELVNQESRYSAKFEEAEKRANEANAKVYELQQKLEAVERDASLKEYNVERLQAELDATLKECDGIRCRLRTQEAEMEALRLKTSEQEDELNLKYQNLEIEFLELNEKLKEVRQLAHDLNSQLIDAKAEVDKLRGERDKLIEERTEEQKVIRETLELALKERAQVEAKWKNDFEQLRNVNTDREEHLMEDCEWKIRTMMKTCKEKLEAAEQERKAVLEKASVCEQESRKQRDEIKQLRSYEAEVAQLRGLTYDQRESLASMTRQLENLKQELETANNKLEEELVKVQQIKNRCEYQLCEKEREALNRIEIARGEIAMQWEDRLLHEMNRLKVELEQMYMEERATAVEKIRKEALQETDALVQKFGQREKQLKEEIDSLKNMLQQQKGAMEKAQTETDQKLLQSRMFVERAEREHEQKLVKEVAEKDEIIDELKFRYEQEKKDMEQHFSVRIQQVQEEFARELSDATEQMKTTHKKELETQWRKLITEKEEALQLMENRNRNRLEDAENKVRELMINHQRQLKDLQEEHTFSINSLETRDTKNAQEIQTLHKKCRCLTNLFEEMRLRYERRDPRPEDLQQIEELKNVIDSQDNDLRRLTEQLRDLQLQVFQPPPPPRRGKNRGKQSRQQQPQQSPTQQKEELEEEQSELDYQMAAPPSSPLAGHPGPVPIVCDIIYEENEADILKEEEEAQALAHARQQIVSRPVSEVPKSVVVELPDSAVQTETTIVHSIEPTIIEDDSRMTVDSHPPAEPVNSVAPTVAPSAPPTTIDTSDLQDESETVIVKGPLEISEENSVATVIELPAVFSKPFPAPQELQPTEEVQANSNQPEIIVVRVPDVIAEAQEIVRNETT